MQHNLGFIIKQLRNDIFSHDIINLVSDFIKNRPLSNISIFTGGCDAIDTKMVPVLHISHANKIYDYSYLKQLFSPKVVNNILSANTDIANMYTKFFNYEPRIYEKLTYGGLYETI